MESTGNTHRKPLRSAKRIQNSPNVKPSKCVFPPSNWYRRANCLAVCSMSVTGKESTNYRDKLVIITLPVT